MKRDIFAGIVLFNPDLVRLRENLTHIASQVPKVVLVDNGSANITEVEGLSHEWDNVEIVKFSKNLGIAEALNEIVRFGEKNKYSWVLTLDQDSVCYDSLISSYRSYLEKEKSLDVGCLCCLIKDRNFSSDLTSKNPKEIKYCITSGSLMNINAMKKIGCFDSKMFIDKVDVDVCINLRKNGFKIVQLNCIGLLHEIGHATQINLGFRKWELYNHSPFRRYYMCRNASYLLKKYHSLYTISFFLKELFQTALVLLFESNKIEKLKVSIIGFAKGLFL